MRGTPTAKLDCTVYRHDLNACFFARFLLYLLRALCHARSEFTESRHQALGFSPSAAFLKCSKKTGGLLEEPRTVFLHVFVAIGFNERRTRQERQPTDSWTGRQTPVERGALAVPDGAVKLPSAKQEPNIIYGQAINV